MYLETRTTVVWKVTHFIFFLCWYCVWDMGGSPGDVSEELVTYEKRNKGWRKSYDVCEATEGLENKL